jgi:hypothetical protein
LQVLTNERTTIYTYAKKQAVLQDLTDLVNVSEVLSLHAKAVAHSLQPHANSKHGGNPRSRSGNQSSISVLHAPPLQAPWQQAVASALCSMLPWLQEPPDVVLAACHASALFNAAMRLASVAANTLQTAAEGPNAAAAVEQPSAIALADALCSYMEISADHQEDALLRASNQREGVDRVMGPTRAVVAALTALASTTVTGFPEGSVGFHA